MKRLEELRRQALSLLSASTAASITTLRASGGAKLDVDALLAKAVARERVSLEMDVLAYEQGQRNAAGIVQKNRNGVRFRDGAMQSLGRSGKGSPFMRDHRQGDSTARGGTVIDSKTVKLTEDGHYQIQQTVELTDPAAVERALRGLMSSVSIGWSPTGPVNCTACGTEIFSKCYHFPFDLVKLKDGTELEVEWEFTAAELVETSEVPVPGVPSAEIKDVRAALAATLSANPGLRSILEREGNFNDGKPVEETQVMDPKLLALLGLSATATPEEILAAVSKMTKDAGADKAELAIATSRLAAFQGDIDALKADKATRDQDTFIVDALASGRMSKGEESMIRALYESSPDRATKLMAERPAGSVTPVGQLAQRANEPAKALVITGGTSLSGGPVSKEMAKLVAQLNANPLAARFAAGAFGYVDPSGAMPTTLGATTIVNNGDLDAARVGFHAAFLQSLEQKTDDPLSLLYTQVPSTKSLETYNWMGDLPAFEEWKADRKLAGTEGFKLSITNKKWSNGLKVKNDDFKDDALGLLPSQVAGLAMKAKRHRWDMMVQLLVNGFAGTAYPDVGNGLGYDGAFFFSDSHATGDNKATAALDATSLAAVELQLASMTTYDGNDPTDIYGTHLIVGPKLRVTAEKLMKQERLANGEDNINKGKYQLMVSNRLRGTYDDYWFLADLSSPIKPLLFQMREEISTSAIIGQDNNNSVPSFLNDELWFGAQARYNVAYFEHRLIVGSAV